MARSCRKNYIDGKLRYLTFDFSLVVLWLIYNLITLQYTFTFQLSKVYSNSLLGDSFDRIEVEEFIKGSVIVNYYVHFKDLDEPVSTNDLKFILNQELEVDGAGPNDDGVSALGRFKVDPIYTDFVGMKCYKRIFIYMDNIILCIYLPTYV